MAECCFVNENVSADLAAEPHHMFYLCSVSRRPSDQKNPPQKLQHNLKYLAYIFYTEFELLHAITSANRILSIMRFVEGVQTAALQWGGGGEKKCLVVMKTLISFTAVK